MPGYDRTGPMGAGPMTGGARGRCNPATVGPIPADTGGYGRGLGLRRGFRGGYHQKLQNPSANSSAPESIITKPWKRRFFHQIQETPLKKEC